MAAQSAFLLDDFVEMAGGDEGIDTSRPKKTYESPFEIDTCYKVMLGAVKGVTSKNGYQQLEAELRIVRGDGSDVPAGKVWLNLPVQSEDIQQAMGPVGYAKLQKKAGTSLEQFLRAFDSKFAAYATRDTSTKPWKFYAADGSELSDDEVKANQVRIGKALVGISKALMTGTDIGLTGRTGYVVNVKGTKENGKGEIPTFTNFYSEPSEKHPMADI